MKQANTTTHLPQACPEWAEKLNAVHRDDLSFEERAELRKHLETCANCRAVRAQYRAIDALLTGLPPVVPLATMPPLLRELKSVREGIAHLLLADDTREIPTQSRILTRKQLPQARQRRRFVGLNMAVTVLMITAIVAGFLILRASHPAGKHTLTGSAKHANAALQHNTYLDVIIGNRHGDSYAVDPFSGTIVWKHQVLTSPGGALFSANGILYYGGANSVLYAIDGGNGQPLWHDQLVPNTQGNSIGWNIVASDDLIFVTTSSASDESTLYALNAYTGAITWKKHRQASQQWLILATANGVLYGESDGLYAWSAQDGHQIWHNSLLAMEPLVVANGKLSFFSAASQGSNGSPIESHQIDIVNASTGQLLRTISINTSGPQLEGLVVSGNALYAAVNNDAGTPSLQAFSLSDAHLLWSKTYNGRILTLSATSKQVYVGLQVLNVAHPTTKNPANYSAWLIALKGDGSEVWRWPDPAGIGMVAAVEINGVVCVVDGGVVGVSASNGHQIWRTNFSQATGFSPVVD